MSTNRTRPRAAHPVRGFIVAFFLGIPMFASGLVAVYSLLEVVLSGWIPTRWFSDNAADWWFGLGVKGSAAAFARFSVSGTIAWACYSGIAWGFNGRGRPPLR